MKFRFAILLVFSNITIGFTQDVEPSATTELPEPDPPTAVDVTTEAPSTSTMTSTTTESLPTTTTPPPCIMAPADLMTTIYKDLKLENRCDSEKLFRFTDEIQYLVQKLRPNITDGDFFVVDETFLMFDAGDPRAVIYARKLARYLELMEMVKHVGKVHYLRVSKFKKMIVDENKVKVIPSTNLGDVLVEILSKKSLNCDLRSDE
uniref:Secreted protein n=1 Tax=Panagrellus redivivus TaxID=6233 RepID=A0A7E4W343_PANRE